MYKEVQRFSRIYRGTLTLFLGLALLSWYVFIAVFVFSVPLLGITRIGSLALVAVFGILIPLACLTTKVTIIINNKMIYVQSLTFFLPIAKKIPLSSIKKHHIATFSSAYDYKNIKQGLHKKKVTPLGISGDKGVLLEIKDGRQLLISSVAPKKLNMELAKARR